ILEPGCNEPCRCEFVKRLLGCPVRIGLGRSRGLSRKYQECLRVVSKERALTCDRNLQCWNKPWRDCYTAYRALDCRPLGMAIRLPDHRSHWFFVADSLASVLPHARCALAPHQRRTGLHSF